MPIFEYRCEKCEHGFEELVRGGQHPVCPECESKHLEKLLSAPVGHVANRSSSLPIGSACPPSDAPPCNPNCCRLQ